MHLYNTLTKKKEEFKPLKEGFVGMYLCGPTVYDAAHLGHGRSAVSFDMIRRYFLYRGFKMKFVSNYTDVDDKMIKRAEEKGMSVADLAEKVIPMYEKDYGDLHILPPDEAPRATKYIEEIIELIKKLEAKGSIYKLDDGVYFDISTFPEYGKLSKQKLEDLQMGARVAVKEGKKNPQDFALWKNEKSGEPAWDSPWGRGRPGWHIECSAMSSALLGENFDIHGGGADLMFPHHECEIAQSESANGKQFANYWMHNGFININEEKMSKSLGNFVTLRDVLEKYSGGSIRLLYMQTHYRSPINFTEDLLEQSKNSIERIHDFIRNLKREKNDGEANPEIVKAIVAAREQFESSMDDDFETSEALASLFGLIKEANILMSEDKLTKGDQQQILEYLEKIDEVFAFIFPKEDEAISDDIEKFIEERNQARKDRDFGRADEIRDILEKKGIILEDLPGGTVWKKG